MGTLIFVCPTTGHQVSTGVHDARNELHGHLLQTERLSATSREAPVEHERSAAKVTLSEFLGSAWWAASERARELGWIV
jgi:hypothetical protein